MVTDGLPEMVLMLHNLRVVECVLTKIRRQIEKRDNCQERHAESINDSTVFHTVSTAAVYFTHSVQSSSSRNYHRVFFRHCFAYIWTVTVGCQICVYVAEWCNGIIQIES